MTKLLAELQPGMSGFVEKMESTGMVKRHLLDMGITPGAPITFRKAAPLGDPIELTVRGYQLSIRKEDAKTIIMNIPEAVKA